MLSREKRISGKNSFNLIFRKGKSKRIDKFNFRFLRSRYLRSSRVSVIVSKKVFKEATKRNRLRRQVYESFRLNWEILERKRFCYDITVLISPYYEKLKYEEIDKIVKEFVSFLI